MPLRLCFATMLGLALLLPLLARADPHYGLENLFWVILVLGGLVLVVTVLSIVLTLLSYRRPQRTGLYHAQPVLLALNALAGLWLSFMSPGYEGFLPLPINPYWGLGLPLGLWLNGVRWARQAPTVARGRIWVSVAVAGLGLLLGVPIILVSSTLLSRYNASSYAGQAPPQTCSWLLAAAVVLASWVVVGQQLRAWLPAAVWQPGWLLALLAAATSTAFTTYGSWITLVLNQHHYLGTAAHFYTVGQSLLLYWAVGLLALLVLRPTRYAAGDSQ